MSAPASWDLEIRLLGDLEFTRPGAITAAAPLLTTLSRKTRALFAYLVATRRRQTRRGLCDLLWEGPDDPLGALRWSLSRLRRALGPDGGRIETLQDAVAFRSDGVRVDWHVVRDLVGDDVDKVPTQSLLAATAELRSEFLDGLHLDDCLRFGAWCAAEREAASTLRLRVLRTLVGRLTPNPEEALPHARAWTAADPLAESGHAALIRLLGALGRHREALEHYGQSRRTLELEAGISHAPEIEMARLSLKAPRKSTPAKASTRAIQPSVAHPIETERLVGRADECEVLQAAFSSREGTAGFVLLSGAPGIGKTRLCTWLAERVQRAGGQVLSGRGFEAETGRPFGVWIDLLSGLSIDAVPPDLRPELVRLLPRLEQAPPGEGDRARLFEAVVAWLRDRIDNRPLLLVFEDLQWVDNASLELLHFVVRSLPSRENLLLVATARSGELADNPTATRLVRELRREDRLRELRLAPLAPEHVQAIATAAYPGIDPAPVLAHAEGNPLFALEAARAVAQGAEIEISLEKLVIAHIERLGQDTRRLLPWAGALGRSFSAELLASVCSMPAAEVDSALGELEQHGVLGSTAEGQCRFSHDVYRQAAHRQVSEPRRRLMHRQIARALAATDDPHGEGAADLARHASLGGDGKLAARAYLAAGQRCLRLFAAAEARGMADRGLHNLGEGMPAAHVGLAVELLRLKVLAGAHRVGTATIEATGAAVPDETLVQALEQAVVAAEASSEHQAAAIGHHALSVLFQDRGELTRAQVHTMSAEAAGRAAGATAAAHQQANTARCLIQLQRDLGHARQLIAEATTTATQFRIEDPDLHWAAGLLHAWDGEPDGAAASLERALALAVAVGDRHREHGCRVSRVLIELERGHADAARARCAELAPIAASLGPAEQAQADALAVLADTPAETPLPPPFANALERLRAADGKAPLAWLLTMAATRTLEGGDVAAARAYATEAAQLADRMGLSNEGARATAVLALASLSTGDAQNAQRLLITTAPRIDDDNVLSAGSRKALRTAAAQLDLFSHTSAHTGPVSQ